MKKVVPLIALLGALVALYQIVFISWPVQKNPELWTDSQNAWFFTLSRIGWAVSYMIIYFFIVFDQIPKLQPILSEGNHIINFTGSMVWPLYILAPVVYMCGMCTMSSAWYMTSLTNIYLGMGGMMTTIIVTVVYMLVIQGPVENLVN